MIDCETAAEPTLNPSAYGERSWSQIKNVQSKEESLPDRIYNFSQNVSRESLIRTIEDDFNVDDVFKKLHADHIRKHFQSAFYPRLQAKGGSLWIPYYQDSQYAFPHAPKKLPKNTIEAYQSLTFDTLTQLVERLITTQPVEYDSRGGSKFFPDMHARVQTMLSHVEVM